MSEQRSTWHVTGRRHDTGEAVSLHVEAKGRERAVQAVERQGIDVTGIEPVTLPYQSPAAPQQEPDAQAAYIDGIRPGAAFAAGFYGMMGALVAQLIVGIAVATVLAWAGVLTFGQ